MIQVADVGIGICGQEGMQVNEPKPTTSFSFFVVHMNVRIVCDPFSSHPCGFIC